MDVLLSSRFLNVLIPQHSFCALWAIGHPWYPGQDILVWSTFKAGLTIPKADGSVIPAPAGRFCLALSHHS